MTTRNLGAVLKARPALLRWQDSPFTRAAIAIRWTGWLANGWRPTTTAAIAALVVVGFAAPWLLAIGVVAGVWARVIDRRRNTAALVSIVSLIGSVWWTWETVNTLTQLALIGLVGVWPLDALRGRYVDGVRMRRWWCEFRRGFPIRYAIMAAKATHIQGVVGGERTLIDGKRPILDHPAITRRATYTANTVWALCSVPPGRNAEAFQDILQELAASYTHVQRMDLIFTDDYQTYGYLVVTFGPPLLNTSAAPTPTGRRFRVTDRAATALPHIGTAAVLAAAIWTGLT